MRALGTVAGGSVALGVLLHGGLRSSAVGVVGLTCGLGFLVSTSKRSGWNVRTCQAGTTLTAGRAW